jgi:hypothetical protein
MTPEEVVLTVRDQVAESSANFFTDAELYRYTTSAERQLANLLGCNDVVSVVTFSTGTYSYTTGVSDYVNIKHITYSGSEAYKLKGVDFRDLQALDSKVMTTSASVGDPTHYWRYGNSIALWPTPDASGTISVYGTKVTTAVVSGATAFAIPIQFTEGLPDYVLYRCYLKDQDDGRANMHLKLWEDYKASSLREWTGRKYADRLLVVKTEEDYPTTELGMV